MTSPTTLNTTSQPNSVGSLYTGKRGSELEPITAAGWSLTTVAYRIGTP
ncbi:MAG: hypothetical protein GY925_29275 [Actinomycetia bacterium]|nr:hypothetical protein [Actinomycetes bacterium]